MFIEEHLFYITQGLRLSHIIIEEYCTSAKFHYLILLYSLMVNMC